MMEDQKEDFELDAGLYELRRKYNEMKKDRQKFQKDAALLQNKLRLLESEEVKVLKKEVKERKTQEELEKIRNDILLEKELIYNSHLEKEKEILNKKVQINNMRENIRSSLSSWRTNLLIKNKTSSEKFKQQKLENEQIIEINKKEYEKKNRSVYEQARLDKLQSADKRKRNEIEKKLKIKKDLEAMILAEENQRNQIEEQINNIHLEEQKIIHRIQLTNRVENENSQELKNEENLSYASPKKLTGSNKSFKNSYSSPGK